MRAFLLASLLLCSLLTNMVNSQTAVRLCGREFLRAVVFSCGGSRWRRIPSEATIEDYVGQDGMEEAGTTTEAERLRRNLENALSYMCCKIGCRDKHLNLLCS